MPPSTPQISTVSRPTDEYGTIDLQVATIGDALAPLILCVHGWPEVWHSWRFQMDYFAQRGYRVAALDVRGYGGSSKPAQVEAYRLRELALDVMAVADELSPQAPVVLLGHDWGAPVVWTAARLFPSRLRGVAGMSVPYRPATDGDPMELWDLLYADRFFYMRYFQPAGVPEAAFSADLGAALRKVYFAACADGVAEGLWFQDLPADHAMLDGLVDPDPAPDWMSPEALAPTLAAFEGQPLHGLFNRYRAQKLDAELASLGSPILTPPTCFIGGVDDIVRSFVEGVDVFASAGEFCADFRGITLIDGAGHWVQQEKPNETNAALDAFIRTL